METSKPWPGTSLGDAGPYSSNTWNDTWIAMSRSGGRLSRVADYDIGVFYAIANALEPASNVTEITVDTGASLIDGLYHENTASVAVPIPASGLGTSRIDVVVVRKNYQQAVTYTPTGGAPTVPPRTARITVIRGTEAAGPVAPSLTQDTTRATYWDIPLAQVQVDDAGALSNFTDLREFVDAETKNIILPAVYSANRTDVTYYLDTNSYIGLIMLDNKRCEIYSHWTLPADYITGLTIYGLARPIASGNINSKVTAYWGKCGEQVNTHTLFASGVTAVTQDFNSCLNALSISPSLDDIVSLIFQRDATDPLDTIGGDVYGVGFYITYFGWKK